MAEDAEKTNGQTGEQGENAENSGGNGEKSANPNDLTSTFEAAYAEAVEKDAKAGDKKDDKPESEGERDKDADESDGKKSKDDSSEDDKSSDESPEGDKKKKSGRSPSERVRQAVNAKREAEEKAETLEKEISELKARFEDSSKGKSDGAEKEGGGKKAENEKIELPSFLENSREAIEKLIHEQVGKIIEPIQQNLEARSAKEQDEIAQKSIEQANKDYISMAKEFPDLFDGEDDDGLPLLKEGMDEKAVEMLKQFEVETTGANGEKVTVNPIVNSSNGLRMLFSQLAGEIEEDAKAERREKDEQKRSAETERLKRSKTESASSKATGKSQAKTLEQMFEEAYNAKT